MLRHSTIPLFSDFPSAIVHMLVRLLRNIPRKLAITTPSLSPHPSLSLALCSASFSCSLSVSVSVHVCISPPPSFPHSLISLFWSPLPPPKTAELELANRVEDLASKNKLHRSYIGLGYHNTIMPLVIKRNILENPGWWVPLQKFLRISPLILTDLVYCPDQSCPPFREVWS